MSSVALLSTHLNDERIEQIRGANVSGPVYLALDADAFPKTIKYVQAFRSRLSMQPVKLIKDLKDLNPQELEEFFNDL